MSIIWSRCCSNHCDGRGIAHGDDDGCGVLERVQRQGLQRSGHRRLHCHRSAAAWSATSTETGSVAQRCRYQNPNGPQAQEQKRSSDLRAAEGDRGAGERADTGGQGPEVFPAARPWKSLWWMVPDCGHEQPAQVVPLPAIKAAVAGGGDRMKGNGLGRSSQG